MSGSLVVKPDGVGELGVDQAAFDDAGSGDAAHNPVYDVNWYDCVKWCNHLGPQSETDR
jgi:hypothetical protein